MAYVKKRRPTAKAWTCYYKTSQGVWRTAPGFPSKQLSLRKAMDLQRKEDEIAAGVREPGHKDTDKSLRELIDTYLGEMKRAGRSDDHLYEQRRLLAKIVSGCRWKLSADITADSLRKWLTALGPVSPRTFNGYRHAMSAFCNWTVSQGILLRNPLLVIKKARAIGGKKTRPRRAYSAEELTAVLASAKEPHRVVFLVASLSGLRRRELKLCEKRDLNPRGDRPVWRLRAEICKGKRKEAVPMLPECAEAIAGIWESLPSETSRLFSSIPSLRTLKRLLARCGIPLVGEDGRHLDFHSFRYTFCTMCAKKLPIQVVCKLMRHRDIRQTCNIYTDLGLDDIAEFAATLPRLLADTDNGGKIR